MKKRAAPWAAVATVAAVALTLAACGSSSPSSSSSTTTSSTAIAPAAALATGTYAPARSSGTPHYVVQISSADGTAFTGTMKFVYQDGTTSRVFDFSGTVSGQSATATASNVASPGSGTKTVSSPLPDPLMIGIGSDLLTFESCQSYLPEAPSQNACAFALSR